MNKYISKCFAVVLLLVTITATAQIDKVEPPFWWEGMHYNQVQVMVYGKDIANLTPEVANATVTGITKTENPNYVFITIDTKNLEAGTYPIQFKKKKKVVATYNFEIKARRENSAMRKGYNSSDMIYLIMPDRFANGTTSNDAAPSVTEKENRADQNGRHGGDIQGIINHLDYLQELGATALWSTPLCEDNDKAYSYHGYAQSDVYKIDPRYGTNQDYVRLGEELHKRDMKLILDYVTNHWGLEHWMVKDLPTYDWIHQFPGYAQTNYRMTTQMDPNASENDFKYCMDGWFVPSMPDLNQSNPLVENYLIQNAIWWIEYANLDGFRVDTYSYNDKEGIAKWTKAIIDEYPYFNIVGEVWLHDQAQIAYWQKDSKIAEIQHYNTYLPSVMDFTLHDAISSVFSVEHPGWDTGMQQFYENFVDDFLYPNINNILVFIENHDTNRFNQMYQNIEDYKLAMALVATVRGIPQLYYGSEIGMAGDKGKGDGDIRRDFPGGWAGDANNAFTKEGRTAKQEAYFDYTAKLFNWRKNAAVIHSGKTTQYLVRDEVYVYFRYTDTETVMVVMNNAKESRTFALDRFAENIKTATKGTDVVTGKTVDVAADTMTIPAKTAYVLELK